MKILVIYNSKTGFTKKYCEWLSNSITCDLVSITEVKTIDLKEYTTIVFASWSHAGKIQKIDWFKKQDLVNCNKIVLVTGASPEYSSEVKEGIESNFESNQKEYTYFYLPAGLSYERMDFASKILLKAFAKMLKNKKDKTQHEEVLAKNLGSSFDNSDEKYLEEVIKYIKSLEM